MAELAALKALSKAKETEEKRLQERRRNVLVLILRHLADHGYADTYERLCSESNLSLQKASRLSSALFCLKHTLTVSLRRLLGCIGRAQPM